MDPIQPKWRTCRSGSTDTHILRAQIQHSHFPWCPCETPYDGKMLKGFWRVIQSCRHWHILTCWLSPHHVCRTYWDLYISLPGQVTATNLLYIYAQHHTDPFHRLQSKANHILVLDVKYRTHKKTKKKVHKVSCFVLTSLQAQSWRMQTLDVQQSGVHTNLSGNVHSGERSNG